VWCTLVGRGLVDHALVEWIRIARGWQIQPKIPCKALAHISKKARFWVRSPEPVLCLRLRSLCLLSSATRLNTVKSSSDFEADPELSLPRIGPPPALEAAARGHFSEFGLLKESHTHYGFAMVRVASMSLTLDPHQPGDFSQIPTSGWMKSYINDPADHNATTHWVHSLPCTPGYPLLCSPLTQNLGSVFAYPLPQPPHKCNPCLSTYSAAYTPKTYWEKKSKQLQGLR
jgi:hypothetical protein